MTSTATHVTTASDVRNAIGHGNTVVAYKGATLVAQNEIPTDYALWAGCTIRTTLHSGKAWIRGEHVPAFWVVVSLVNQNGYVVWHKGNRWTGERAEWSATDAYQQAVTS